MFFPMLKKTGLERVTVTDFPGLDRRETAKIGGFREMRNLCGEGYPALRTRQARGLTATVTKPGGLTAKDALIWVDGTRLRVNGEAAGPVLTEGEKDLISMGAYLIVFPDKVYLNTKDLTDYGSLECERTASAGVAISLCDAEGTAYSGVVQSAGAPEDPEEGALWMDVSGPEPVLRQYGQDCWTVLQNVCVKLQATLLGKGFAAGDGVTVSGCAAARLNGEKVLQATGENWVVFPGIVEGNTSQKTAVTISRTVPDMDFVVQSGNRLWGCRYGMTDGKAVNEIYASKLGDFKNWRCFEGLSTDSYAAARGSDGAFTGAVSYLGNPIFFKERCMERVYAGSQGAHQIVTTECSGVQKGSAKSLQVVGGVLYYLSGEGVQAFDGSLPVGMSAALGDEMYFSAVGGAYGKKYYVSMCDGQGAYSLFVLDIDRGIWHREDSTRALMFARSGRELFYIDEPTGRLMAVNGTQGTAETAVSWCAESGVIGYEYPDQKTLSRFDLRMQLASTGSLQVFLEYDSSGSWEDAGTIGAASGNAGKLRTFLLPIVPRRCDHVRMKLQGTGEMKLFSIARILEIGSDGGL